jgi:hypothetical protein
MIKKIIKWFKRNPCIECKYYLQETNICQSKKCATYGNHPYVNKIDRLLCEACKDK